jgi:LUD domain
VSTTAIPDRFTVLPDEHALEATVVALEEHGFSVEVVGDAARQAVLARIPEGSSVMTNTSVTLAETGIADAINDGGGRWESARSKVSSAASRSATEPLSPSDPPRHQEMAR